MHQRVSDRLAPLSIAVFLVFAAAGTVALRPSFPCLNCWTADGWKRCGVCLNDRKYPRRCADGSKLDCEFCCAHFSDAPPRCFDQCLATGAGSNDNPKDSSDDLSD